MTKVKRPSDENLEYIRKFYSYNDNDGTVDGPYAKNVGSIHTNHSRSVYKIGMFGRKIRRAHIIWFLEKNEWPTSQLDHKDRNSLNDKIDNLREVDDFEQQQNKDIYSGYRGFSVLRQREYTKIRYKQWRARAQKRGVDLGYFISREEAIAAVDEYWMGRGMVGESWNFEVV